MSIEALNSHFVAVHGTPSLALLSGLTAISPSATAAGGLGAIALDKSLRLGSAHGQIFAPPAALNGMALDTKPGPRTLGLPSFIATLLPLQWIAIRRGVNGPVLAFIHAGTPVVGPGPAGSRQYKFGAGSLWIAAKQFASQAPAGGLAGVAIQQATLIVPAPIAPGAGTDIVIGAAATAELTFVPAPAPPVAAGLSNQGTTCVVALPASVGLALAPAAAQVKTLADATLSVTGQTFTVSGGWIKTSFDAIANEIAFAYKTVAPARISLTPNAGGGVNLSGSAAVSGGDYRLPVAIAAPPNLGAAANGGLIALTLGAGLSATWGQRPDPEPLGPAILKAQTGGLGLAAQFQQRSFRDTYPLWNAERPAGLPPQATDVTFVVPRGAVLFLVESAANEAAIVIGCRVEAHIDRPVTVRGAPVGLTQLEITYAWERTVASDLLFILGAPGPANQGFPPPSPEVFALVNALLYTNGVAGLLGIVRLDGRRGVAGVIYTGAAIGSLLPTLPDPYASSFITPVALPQGTALIGATVWSAPADATAGFLLSTPAASGGLAVIREGLRGLLLDVSSNADQFGLALTGRTANTLQVFGETLLMSGAALEVATLPHIAWEAVISDSTTDPQTGLPVPAPRQWFPPFSPDDGDIMTLTAPTQTLRPVVVQAAIDDCITQYGNGAILLGNFTLPFGITAELNTDVTGPNGPLPRPTLSKLSGSFGSAADPLQAGLQLRLSAGNPKAGIPGSSDASSGYATAMLSPPIASFWGQQFDSDPNTFVPITGIDFSGYGASMFSYWQNSAPVTEIDQVRFDVVVGRTSYELVEAQSFILPCVIPTVNTTILARDAGGYVARHNTGWQPRGPGMFKYSDPTPVQTGAMLGVQNVHNIRETGAPDVKVTEGAKTWVYRPVSFDADVVILVNQAQHGLKLAGDPAGGLVPTRGMIGYLAMTVGFSPTLARSVALLDQVAAVNSAPAAGPISIDATVASTGLGFSLTGVDIKATRNDVAPRTLGAAVRGTPHLPRDGAWSVSRRTPTDKGPAPIDPTTPVPLVRSRADTTTWHMADPEDATKLDAPRTFYGLVQATGTQKVVFEHPTFVAGAASPLQPRAAPHLADVGALLGASGLLPDLSSLLDLGAFGGFKPAGDGLSMQTLQKDVAIPPRTIITLGPVRVIMGSNPLSNPAATSHFEVDIDAGAPPGNRWSVSATNIAFGLTVDGFGDPTDPLITVHGDALAKDGAAPTLTNLDVEYGSALSEVKTILSGIQAATAFLPGGGGTPFSIDFAGTTLKIRETFALPQLPLGLGYLEHIALDMGFDINVLDQKMSFFIGVGTDEDPFSWLVSPLAGNGILQLGANDQLGVKLQAGVGVGLGIDLAIASGSASIVLAAQIDTSKSPLVLMVLLTGNASVDVLDGLASAALTLTAGLGIGVTLPAIDPVTDPIDFVKQTTVTLTAEVAVGIHLSICWVCHVDWSGSWPFSETVSGEMLASLV